MGCDARGKPARRDGRSAHNELAMDGGMRVEETTYARWNWGSSQKALYQRRMGIRLSVVEGGGSSWRAECGTFACLVGCVLLRHVET